MIRSFVVRMCSIGLLLIAIGSGGLLLGKITAPIPRHSDTSEEAFERWHNATYPPQGLFGAQRQISWDAWEAGGRLNRRDGVP